MGDVRPPKRVIVGCESEQCAVAVASPLAVWILIRKVYAFNFREKDPLLVLVAPKSPALLYGGRGAVDRRGERGERRALFSVRKMT